MNPEYSAGKMNSGVKSIETEEGKPVNAAAYVRFWNKQFAL
jgi:hypothetical protein